MHISRIIWQRPEGGTSQWSCLYISDFSSFLLYFSYPVSHIQHLHVCEYVLSVLLTLLLPVRKTHQSRSFWGDRGLLLIKCCRNKAEPRKKMKGVGRRGRAVQTCPASLFSLQSQEMTHLLCCLNLSDRSVGYRFADVYLNGHLCIWALRNMSDCLVVWCNGWDSSFSYFCCSLWLHTLGLSLSLKMHLYPTKEFDYLLLEVHPYSTQAVEYVSTHVSDKVLKKEHLT